jgi:hypothetical protein
MKKATLKKFPFADAPLDENTIKANIKPQAKRKSKYYITEKRSIGGMTIGNYVKNLQKRKEKVIKTSHCPAYPPHSFPRSIPSRVNAVLVHNF